MSAIRILSDKVANQIAAGEVIERPVAVIKELIENSIDAGASRIEVEFRNGGKSYMRVEDNGCGMTPDEALLALERHATSKIRETRDLHEVRSFGFRGEALPSIASVSRFTLRTRAEGWTHGTEIQINGGKLLKKQDCGMPVGTVIEVANLFQSVPARRKFLKTDPTESAHITYNARLFAVAHPGIAFRVLERDRVVFQSPACENLRDRIAEIWGRAFADDLMPIEADEEGRGFHLAGLTARPGVGRSTRRELVTLVNRRPVDSRTLGFAVLDAYHGRIQKGRYPPAFLFFDLPSREVDINVHPAKREVRFRDDGAVRRFVLNSIADALGGASTPAAPDSETSRQTPPRPDAKETPEASASGNSRHPGPPEPPVNAGPASGAPAAPPSPETAPAASRFPSSLSPEPETPEAEPAPSQASPPAGPPEPPESAEPSPATAQGDTTSALRDWHLLDRPGRRYALFNTPKGLLLLHLRRADQRVRFERILKQLESRNPPTQRLLIPQPISLEPLAAETLKSARDFFLQHGFQIEEFGRNFFRIESLPTWLNFDHAETFVRDLIDAIRQRGTREKHRSATREFVARLASDGSYRRNDDLSDDAIRQLAADLLACQIPHTAPGGKKTFTEISWNELEKRLGDE